MIEHDTMRARGESMLGMPLERFLREHWQKKPLFVKGALSRGDFTDPLTPEELAGLACEEGVESRIVRQRGARRWDVFWGPHPEERFTGMPARRWTLLVQEYNRHVPEAALLLERFAFVPNVRVDDVMVSYAAPGGGVGPHLDSYDVFLVQGMGQRRWRYGASKAKDARFVPDLDLRILERFAPDHEVVCEPGDLLYLPPGVAHEGTAVTPCLTYSVGFRAPSFGEMWKDRARDVAARSPRASELLVDPPLSPAVNPGEIPPALLASVRAAMRAADASDDELDRWFARFATRLTPEHTLVPPKKSAVPTFAKLRERLARGDVVHRTEEGRWAFLPVREKRAKGGLRLYVGGEELEVPSAAADLARALCASRRFDEGSLAPLLRAREARDLIVRLFAMGALRLGRR